MRILVYGAGVLGCNLANNLFKAGKDVTLLARGTWYQQIKKNGLVIDHQYMFRKDVSRINVIDHLDEDDLYDAIFVVMRYNQIDSVMDSLKTNVSKNIIFVGNNVRPQKYRDALSDKKVLFAFALSAGHREKDRVVSVDLKKITIGTLKDERLPDALIHEIFYGTKYKVVIERNMEDYLLCHIVFVMPIAIACYKCDGDLTKIKNDNAYLHKVIDANVEGYAILEKAGHEILPEDDANYASSQWKNFVYAFYKLMAATKLGKICASDHAMNAVDEMSLLNEDLKAFFDANGGEYPVYKEIEADTGEYLA